jgi:hypothetical protein
MGDAREGVCGDTGEGRPWALPPWVEVPADFTSLAEPLPAGLDRRLGYPGERRFVAFRYEPRGEEVIWDDGHTYGFGTGGWSAFLDRVAPLAARYGVDLGIEPNVATPRRRPTHHTAVLLLDRTGGCAYFAGRASTERFLSKLAETQTRI